MFYGLSKFENLIKERSKCCNRRFTVTSLLSIWETSTSVFISSFLPVNNIGLGLQGTWFQNFVSRADK